MKKEQKSRNHNISMIILFFIFFIIMVYTGIEMIIWLKENNENKNIIEKIEESIVVDETVDTVDKYKVDFETLKSQNEDVFAWFKVNGTNIKYPVVKASDNDYYMNHSFDKTYNSAGWIFMDYKDEYGVSKNIVLYGHNRKDGSMFGTLSNILTEEWQNNSENYIIPFITETENAEYQVFSVYTVKDEDYYIKTSFNSDSEFKTFIDKIKSRSDKDFEVQVDENDSILTLSTCANNNQYRVVLHAKKIK